MAKSKQQYNKTRHLSCNAKVNEVGFGEMSHMNSAETSLPYRLHASKMQMVLGMQQIHFNAFHTRLSQAFCLQQMTQR